MFIESMTIEELQEIIKIMDYDGICAEIEKRGFRKAGEDGVWEFNLWSLWDKSGYAKGITKEDKKTDKYFLCLRLTATFIVS